MSNLSRSLSGMACVAVLAVSFVPPRLLAQATATGPALAAPPAAAPASMEFDVVSVKPNTTENGMTRVANKPGMFSASNVTLKLLISQAYNIRADLISGGPGWVDSASYDLEGKIAPADADVLKAMTNEQRGAVGRQMMQHALADRFKLKAHIETKMLPVYELVLVKGGAKLKEADPNDTYPNGMKGPDGVGKAGVMRMQPGKLIGQGIPISSLINNLAYNTERTVIDKTGLTGKYDITLTWKPEDDHGGQENGAADTNLPDLFTAVQEQLGLKLVSTKGPVDTLVIDSVEKPVEN